MLQFQPVVDVEPEADFKHRRWNKVWWMNQRAILKVLAQHDSTYSNVPKEEDEEIAIKSETAVQASK